MYGIRIKSVCPLLRQSTVGTSDPLSYLARSIVNPFFVKTGIFGVVPKLLLAGIPLPTVEEVVAAMIAATCKPDSTGSAFVVDFKCVSDSSGLVLSLSRSELASEDALTSRAHRGILELPSAVYNLDGYYHVFASRAQGLMGCVLSRAAPLSPDSRALTLVARAAGASGRSTSFRPP